MPYYPVTQYLGERKKEPQNNVVFTYRERVELNGRDASKEVGGGGAHGMQPRNGKVGSVVENWLKRSERNNIPMRKKTQKGDTLKS